MRQLYPTSLAVSALIVSCFGQLACQRSGRAAEASGGDVTTLVSASAQLPALAATAPGQTDATSTAPAPLTLREAVAVYLPQYKDTRDVLDEGSARLALWLAAHPSKLSELDQTPMTSAALYRRDPEAERGHQLCVDGILREIRAERNLAHRLSQDRAEPLIPAPPPASTGTTLLQQATATTPEGFALRTPDAERDPSGEQKSPALPSVPQQPPSFDPQQWQVSEGKIYFATVMEPLPAAAAKSSSRSGTTTGWGAAPKPLLVEAIAVGDGARLVDGDHARFCGILTGVTEASGSTGDRVLEHRAVGRFRFESGHPHGG